MSDTCAEIGALFRRSQALLSALGDETRQTIVAMLLDAPAPMSVNQISAHVRLSQPAVSHHLKILKHAGLLDVRRSGKQRLYSIAGTGAEALQPLADLIAHVASIRTSQTTPANPQPVPPQT
jgi:ArsR family transcriptional regulator